MREEARAEAHARRAADLLTRFPSGDMPDEAWRNYAGEAQAAVRSFEIVRGLKRESERRQANAAKVSREPGPYDEGSPNSWVRDVMAAKEPRPSDTGLISRMAPNSDMSPLAVERRLHRHGQDIAEAIRKGSKFGKRAAAIIAESTRCEHEDEHRRRAAEALEEARQYRPAPREARAFGSGGGATASAGTEGGAFVPPAILLKSWAAYRTPFASFASQCKAEDLPSWGMNVYVPHLTGAMEVTSQTEGSAPAEKAPAAGFITGAVVNKAGQLKTSQQYLDRAGPGISGDKFLFEQIKVEIDTEVDKYALYQALASAQEVTNTTATFALTEKEGVGGFVGEVRKGKNLLATTAGTRIKATHLFAPSKVVNYLEAWGMSTTGPVWGPHLDDNRLEVRSEGDAHAEGYSGYLLSGLAVFADDNLPKQGTVSNYQLVVARPETVLLFQASPVFYAYPESYSTTLDAALGARVYVAVVPRCPEGVAVLNGAFYKESTFA